MVFQQAYGQHSGRKSPGDEDSDLKSVCNILTAISEGLSNFHNYSTVTPFGSVAIRARVERVQAATLAAVPALFGEFSLALVSSLESFSTVQSATASPKRENGNLQKHRERKNLAPFTKIILASRKVLFKIGEGLVLIFSFVDFNDGSIFRPH